MDEFERRGELAEQWASYRSRPIPKDVGETGILDDVETAFYEEDGYLAGLVTTLLKASSEPFSAGQLLVDRVVLNTSIDNALADARPLSDHGKIMLEAWQSYRDAMRQIARAVGDAAKIPVVDEETGL